MLNGVTRKLAYAAALVAVLQLAGCRQADGPMPQTTPETANELGDISRDLQNLATGNAEGPKDLADDISDYAQDTKNGQAAAQELSNRLGQALTGKKFKLAEAMPLAQTCWETVASRQLSEKQVDNLKNEMKSQLMTLGVEESRAQSVADQVGVVQQAVTARHRRWYEML